MEGPKTRSEFVQLGVDLLQQLINEGQLNSAREIIEKNRRQVRLLIENDQDPPGHLMEKLSRCMGMGWINDLLKPGDFDGPLRIEKK